MRSTLVLSALAAAVAAIPAPIHYRYLSFSPDSGNTTLNAVLDNTGEEGSYVLRGLDPADGEGSQFYFSGSDGALNMIFVPDGSNIAGATAPEVGDDYGYAAPVTVTDGTYGDGAWTYFNSTNTLYHQQHAALETFFACNDEINGLNQTVLNWGVPRDDVDSLAPVGCEYVTVYVNDAYGAP